MADFQSPLFLSVSQPWIAIPVGLVIVLIGAVKTVPRERFFTSAQYVIPGFGHYGIPNVRN